MRCYSHKNISLRGTDSKYYMAWNFSGSINRDQLFILGCVVIPIKTYLSVAPMVGKYYMTWNFSGSIHRDQLFILECVVISIKTSLRDTDSKYYMAWTFSGSINRDQLFILGPIFFKLLRIVSNYSLRWISKFTHDIDLAQSIIGLTLCNSKKQVKWLKLMKDYYSIFQSIWFHLPHQYTWRINSMFKQNWIGNVGR